jgi:hypothetical protein
MNTEALKEYFLRNGEEIRRLDKRIHETYLAKTKGTGTTEAWSQACAEFHARYDGLAFPGGYDSAVERMANGDPEAIEAALCFVEVRPYFFRSGYMFKILLRKLKRAPLSEKQSRRFVTVVRKYDEWRQQRREGIF